MPGVLIRTSDAAAESLQVQIKPRRQVFRKRIVKRAPALGIRGGYIELPMIADLYEMTPYLHRCKRARRSGIIASVLIIKPSRY